MAKREFTIKIDDANQLVQWHLGDKVVLTFDAKLASPENRAHAALHGFKQAIGDTAALDKGATVEEKIAEMDKKRAWFEDATNTDWAMKGGGGRVFDVGTLVMALAAVKFGGVTEELVEKASNAVDKTAELRKIDRTEAAKMFAADALIAAEMAAIRARKQPVKLDADALLSEVAAFTAAPGSGGAEESAPKGKNRK